MANSCCGCMITSTAGIVGGVKFLPPEIQEVIDALDRGGANIHADALFSFFWDDHQGDDLDMWLSYGNSNDMPNKVGYNSGGGGRIGNFDYHSYNHKLDTGLDYDAWAGGNNRKGKSLENIGTVKSTEAPDGIYGVYLDNFKNYTGRDTPFNFVCLYKDEGEDEFRHVLWLRGVMNKDRARGNGDITKMLHVVDLQKTGKKFSLHNITSQLHKVFEFEFGG